MKTFDPIITLIIFLSCLTLQSAGNNKAKNQPADTLILQSVFPFQRQHCHGSTIVELPNKDLLVAWFQGSGERTSDDVAIRGARYNHKTGTWGEPFVMADVPGFPDINPVLFVDNQSRLWLFWYTVMAYQWSTSLLKYRYSDNYMQKSGPPIWSWQDVIPMKPDGGMATEGITGNDSFVANQE